MVGKASTPASVLPLQCPVQHYAWGCGKDGLVARLAHDTSGQPCAELWMGTHPSGPSRLESGKLLSDHINGALLFLFKILSVKTALSIQAHPDHHLAIKLHARNPHAYPDPNHKPEMAIALTRFEALCSFRPQHEIERIWASTSELMFLTIVSDIQTMFTRIMQADKEKIAMVGEKLLLLDDSMQSIALFKRLWHQYPNDVGCFCVFLMNHIVLEPGEAIFLAANEPHAYISGDCVECMAASDNVVRAGLTPKPRDLPTLINMLTYKQFQKDDLVIRAAPHGAVREYRVPVREFAVNAIRLQSGDIHEMESLGHSILIVLEGKGSINGIDFDKGSIFYFGAGSVKISSSASTQIYLAFTP